MPVASQPRARRLSYADRHEHLLDVAFELLEAGGSEAARMDALARAAGVTRPVVYEHFANREALLVALIEQHGRRLYWEVAAADAASGDFETDLRSSVRAYVAGVKRRGAGLRSVMSSIGVSPTVERARSRVWDVAIDNWAARYQRGFEIDRADARLLAEFHLHGLWGLAGRCAAGEISASRVEDLHTTIVLASLEAFSNPSAPNASFVEEPSAGRR